ncbi:MAG: phospholipid scramblase-related protein [Myxococcota bacterium]
MTASLASLFVNTEAVSIKQKRELSEVVLGFDVANRYRVLDQDGQSRGEVLEEANGLTGMLFRNVLSTWRPLVMHVRDVEGYEVAKLTKSFSLFFHRLVVHVGGQTVGSVQRRWSLLGRKYDVHDASGRLVARIRRPLFRLWTYPVTDPEGNEIARIGKRWGGLFNELFTDADTYGVYFTEACGPELRTLLFSAMFLIDMTNTEDNANSGGLLSVT